MPGSVDLVALVVLDGWGCAPPGPGNAVELARTPVFDRLWAEYPHTTLAASGEAAGWAEEAVTLLRVADAAGAEPVEQVHVATQAGEVFALRAHGFAAIAVTERFALASLTFFDMRSALRERGLPV